MNELGIVILAAGQGTRMKSKTPKVLHLVAGQPMIQHVLNSAAQFEGSRVVVVVGHGADAVRQRLGSQVEFVVQEQQLGTGHAVLQASPLLQGRCTAVLVLSGDMPLLSAETVRSLVETHTTSQATLTMLTTIVDGDAMGFGRIVRDGQGHVQAIVEEADATPEQLAIRELNCGLYCFDSSWLWEHLPQLPVSAKGEYYLTDLVRMAVEEERRIDSVLLRDCEEAVGINTRVQLAAAEAAMRGRLCRALMLSGVTIVDPASTYIDVGVSVGQDTVIYPNTYLHGNTAIGTDCLIGPNTIVRDSTVGDACRIEASVVEGAVIERGVSVGPFGHLRSGAHLAEGVHMGNFGEVKNSYLGPGVKMGHFSYVGDATIGRDVNIAAGTITCNYDGEKKHRTVIDEGAFVGSDTMLVAPVHIGAHARIGAGSVVTHDVPAGSTVYGVPARDHTPAADDRQ